MKISFAYNEDLVKELLSIQTNLANQDLVSINAKTRVKILEEGKINRIKNLLLIDDIKVSSEDIENALNPIDSATLNEEQILIRNLSNCIDLLEIEKKKETPFGLNLIYMLNDFLNGLSNTSRHLPLRQSSADNIFYLKEIIDGEIVNYLPSEASNIRGLLNTLLGWLDFNKDVSPFIKASVSVFTLLSIAPFEKYNYSLSFLLSSSFLLDYEFLDICPLEVIINKEKELFFSSLSMGLPPYFDFGREYIPHLEIFISYYCKAINKALIESNNIIKESSIKGDKDVLLGLNKKDIGLITYCITHKKFIIRNSELATEFDVTPRAISKWAKEWVEKGILIPESGKQRTTSYRLSPLYASLKLSDLKSIN